LAVLTAVAWDLTTPRFVPYLAAALAVEAAFALAGRRRAEGLRPALLAGAGVATVGLAGAWAATHVWGWQPWQPSLLRTLPVAMAAAVGAAVLGTAFGRAVGHRPVVIGAPALLAAGAVVLLALAAPLPRLAPDATVTIRATPADGVVADLREGADAVGLVDLEVLVEPAGAAAAVDRFEVLAWQGGGLATTPLLEVAPGHHVAADPMPVGGTWKTLVRLGDDRVMGAAPVWMPADPEIDAPEVPLVAERTVALTPDVELMLRERTDGPLWPGVIGYAFTFTSLAAVMGLQAAGAVALERRRRERRPAEAPTTAPVPAGR
jgi:hypothetical protein